MARRKSFTNKRRELFLERLAANGSVSVAAREIGISRQYMYKLRDKSPDFAAEWATAELTFLDRAENELLRRGLIGIERTKVKIKTVPGSDGEANRVVETVEETMRVFSDRNLQFYLSHRHPDYQKPLRVEASGPGRGPIQYEDRSGWDLSALSYDDLKTLRSLHRKATQSPRDPAA